MKRIFTLLILAAALVTVPSCSKEKRLERMLHKSDGDWNITSMTFTYVSTDNNGVIVTASAIAENAGSFHFDKEGDGSYSFTLGGVTHAQAFGWSTSDETLVIKKIAQSVNISTFSIDQLVVAFSGEKSDKNQIELSGTETIQSTMDSEFSQKVLTVNMTLDKK